MDDGNISETDSDVAAFFIAVQDGGLGKSLGTNDSWDDKNLRMKD